MKIQIEIGGEHYTVDQQAIDISIPMRFSGEQPNTYGVAKATGKAFEGGGFVGDTRRGGSCNFETYSLTPHCNGTHTECVGHIAYERIAIHPILQDSFIPSTLISLHPQKPQESYQPELNPEDRVFTRQQLETALADTADHFLQALIIRSLPNEPSKHSRDYMQEVPPFFTIEAAQYIVERGVKHLLVDMPSVDRLLDEGKMSVHHIFWGLPAESHEVDAQNPPLNTITEMIFVPDEVADGNYLLNLQIAPFMTDAAPSRPRIFSLNLG